MKRPLTLFFFLIPFFLFSQNAYTETKTIIEYDGLLERNDLPLLLEIYVKKTNFSAIQKAEVEQVLQFIEDPFRADFDYENFKPNSVAVLNTYILDNTKDKEEIKEKAYYLVLACNNTFPADYFSRNSCGLGTRKYPNGIDDRCSLHSTAEKNYRSK